MGPGANMRRDFDAGSPELRLHELQLSLAHRVPAVVTNRRLSRSPAQE